MGPGSFDPGNAAQALAHIDQTGASMGPGSFDPGNGGAAGEKSGGKSRFNGAGVF